jgi:hypothetical protein
MSAAEALEIVRRLGLDRHIAAVVDNAPAIPESARPIVADLRRKKVTP